MISALLVCKQQNTAHKTSRAWHKFSESTLLEALQSTHLAPSGSVELDIESYNGWLAETFDFIAPKQTSIGRRSTPSIPWFSMDLKKGNVSMQMVITFMEEIL